MIARLTNLLARASRTLKYPAALNAIKKKERSKYLYLARARRFVRNRSSACRNLALDGARVAEVCQNAPRWAQWLLLSPSLEGFIVPRMPYRRVSSDISDRAVSEMSEINLEVARWQGGAISMSCRDDVRPRSPTSGAPDYTFSNSCARRSAGKITPAIRQRLVLLIRIIKPMIVGHMFNGGTVSMIRRKNYLQMNRFTLE